MPYFERFRTVFSVGLALRTVTVRVVDDDVVLDVDLDVSRYERPGDLAPPRERPRPDARVLWRTAAARHRPRLLGADLLTHRIASAARPRPRPRPGGGRPSLRAGASGVRLFVHGAGRPWPGAGGAWSE